ncbi:hypothetical protein V5F77_19830 [Xanthobacter sp. DSM 24535]|uniref:hypothetical protein n=1 Tax=Roseixanthobacter psychrophilus TaxID=3119917 RepID=UPI003726B30C
MKIIDNTSLLLGDDLKATLGRGARLKIAASCFSIYAFEALKSELSKVESLQFIFTAPTFVPMEMTDRLRKERREFFIPKATRDLTQPRRGWRRHGRGLIPRPPLTPEPARL